MIDVLRIRLGLGLRIIVYNTCHLNTQLHISTIIWSQGHCCIWWPIVRAIRIVTRSQCLDIMYHWTTSALLHTRPHTTTQYTALDIICLISSDCGQHSSDLCNGLPWIEPLGQGWKVVLIFLQCNTDWAGVNKGQWDDAVISWLLVLCAHYTP